jgi:hypothetical protein
VHATLGVDRIGALRKLREGQISEVSLDFRSVIDVIPRFIKVSITPNLGMEANSTNAFVELVEFVAF